MLLRPSFRSVRKVPHLSVNPKSQNFNLHNTIGVLARQLSSEQSPPSPTPEPGSSTIPGSCSKSGSADSLSQPKPAKIPDLAYPISKSPYHNDLPSFLQYAKRVGLDKTSSVYVGTQFEYTVASTLSIYGFSLQRIGGASDAGVDLLGTWSLPLSSSSSPLQQQIQPPLRVILQCKVTPSPRPSLIRELEGAFIGAPSGWRMNSSSSSRGVLGFLVLDKPATKGIREALGRSRWPMAFIYCSKEGIVEQFLWNERAVSAGLEGLGVVKRYAPQGQQVALTFRGRTLPYVGTEMGDRNG